MIIAVCVFVCVCVCVCELTTNKFIWSILTVQNAITLACDISTPTSGTLKLVEPTDTL